MAVKSLEDLFLHTLQDMYFAETHITKKLPTMAKEAKAADLRKAFESHLEETKTHVARLEKVFDQLGKDASGEECPAIEGITKEAEKLLKEIEDPATKDAALIAAAQAVEHYEITRYGTMIAWAEELGYKDAIPLLKETLGEEKAADKKLLTLGEERLNKKAA